MEPEKDEGNIEYKLKLLQKNDERIESLTSQMRYRCDEGGGECIYMLGVSDDGKMIGMTDDEYQETIYYIENMAKKNNYMCTLLSKKNINNNKYIYEILIREINDNKYIDIKVAITGGVDAGKSTMLSSLITGKKDNGRGLIRLSVFNHNHEVRTGRTSSVSQNILGFDSKGDIVNYNDNDIGNKSWPEITKNSVKVITLFDLAGHEKYLKTTIRGLTESTPNVCFILVGSNMGVSNMTREHMFLCLSLKIPFVIIITKIDICKDRQNVLNETVKGIKKLIQIPGVRKIPFKISNKDDIIIASQNISSGVIVPIFKTSSVTGEGIDYIKTFLNLLQNNTEKKSIDDEVEYHIESTFYVTGVGTVVGGQLIKGKIKVGDKLYLGPNNDKYEQVQIRSIHCKKVPMTEVYQGKYVCLALRKIQRSNIKRGNVIVNNAKKLLVKEFDADITVLKTHSTTIKIGYEPVIHTYSIRQSAKIISIKDKKNARNVLHDDSILRTGDKASVRFKFCFRKEYIKPDWRIFLCEGKVKIIGIIRNIY